MTFPDGVDDVRNPLERHIFSRRVEARRKLPPKVVSQAMGLTGAGIGHHGGRATRIDADAQMTCWSQQFFLATGMGAKHSQRANEHKGEQHAPSAV